MSTHKSLVNFQALDTDGDLVNSIALVNSTRPLRDFQMVSMALARIKLSQPELERIQIITIMPVPNVPLTKPTPISGHSLSLLS